MIGEWLQIRFICLAIYILTCLNKNVKEKFKNIDNKLCRGIIVHIIYLSTITLNNFQTHVKRHKKNINNNKKKTWDS